MRRGRPRKLTALALLAATYCIVSGGPYGIEDIVGKSGYGAALLILLVTPLIWAIPTALMVSELSSAIPLEGGFYTWVSRGMGPFWGFQEAWLSLTGSIFDMAIYPTLFVSYLAQRWPALGAGWRPIQLGILVIAGCVVWNLFSARAVGRGSIVVTALILSPFLVIVGLALAHGGGAVAAGAPRAEHLDLMGGIMIAMWNYMGWDNASTVAGEVERPERTYPATMFRAVLMVTLLYVIPVGVMAWAGVDLAKWSTGGWVAIAGGLGGAGLATAVLIGAAVSNVGTFNALTLSLTRLPMVMAEDGFLPRIFAWRHPASGVPVVSLLVSAVTWGAVLGLGFEHVLFLDVLLSGLSVLLEFWALVALRVREPRLRRPFRVPGGLPGAVAVGLGPLALIVVSCVRTGADSLGNVNALALGAGIMALGPVFYTVNRIVNRRSSFR